MISTTGGRARSAWRAIQPSASLDARGGHRRAKPGLARDRGERGGRVMLVAGHRDGVDGRATGRGRVEHARRVLVGEQAEDEVEGRPAGMAAEMIGDGARGGGIVGAVEPELGLRRAAGRAAAPAPARCSRAGHSAQPIAARSAESGTSSASWWRSIATASAAFIAWWAPARRGRGRSSSPARVAIVEPAVAIVGVPGAAARQPERARRRRGLADPRGERRRIGLGDERHALLGDARFLGGDLLERVAEEGVMVVAELGDAADERRGDDVGRVEPAAEPDLDDAGVGGRAREGEEGGRRGRLEEADLHVAGGVERLGEQSRQRLVLDQPAGEADALVEADEMRAGIDMDG